MIFIGIDPSLSGTGLAAGLNEGKPYVCTVDPKKLKGLDRLGFVVESIVGFTAQYKDLCTEQVIIGMEDYTAMSQSAATTPLKELGGCIKYELWKAGYKLHDLSSTGKSLFIQNQSQMKKWWFRDGSMAKTSRYLMDVKTITGIEFEDDNTADAWMHCNMLKDHYNLAVAYPVNETLWTDLWPERREVVCSMVRSAFPKESPSLAKLAKLGNAELSDWFKKAWLTV